MSSPLIQTHKTEWLVGFTNLIWIGISTTTDKKILQLRAWMNHGPERTLHIRKGHCTSQETDFNIRNRLHWTEKAKIGHRGNMGAVPAGSGMRPDAGKQRRSVGSRDLQAETRVPAGLEPRSLTRGYPWLIRMLRGTARGVETLGSVS